MNSAYDYLGLTAQTCRWPPCGNALESASATYCSDSHRVRASQEAKRLGELLALLTTDRPERRALVAHVPAAARARHVRQAQRRVAARLSLLRPEGGVAGVAEGVAGAVGPEGDSLVVACREVVRRWPTAEVSSLLRLALRRPKIYLQE